MVSRRNIARLPRFFAVQSEDDVIVLDTVEDKYYWRENASAELLSPDADAPEDLVIVSGLQTPTLEGYPPRGPFRYWKFEIGLVCVALYFLISSKIMVSRGIPRFAARLDKMLRNAQSRAGTSNAVALSRIATAMEWARLLVPFEAKCLPISVATARMARRYGIQAEVVFGVHALPLEAHAWAQIDAQLINDFLDRVRGYRPIMTLPLRNAFHSAD